MWFLSNYMYSYIKEFIWWDFRLATLFTVIAPLLLLVWALISKNLTFIRSLTIYWRVSALLAITVYLLIGNLSVGYITGWTARILIPTSLWFWQDLNQLIGNDRSKLKTSFIIWRWIMTVYCAIGTLTGITFLPCSLEQEFIPGVCGLLTEAPLQFKAILHPNLSTQILGNGAIACLAIYLIYFGIFVVFKLRRQGRTAIKTV
jgi:Protein of unknown function (DUF3177)